MDMDIGHYGVNCDQAVTVVYPPGFFDSKPNQKTTNLDNR